jgi:hypothetical protein
MTEALEFHPLTFVPGHDGVMVGRLDTESYAVLPADGAELLRRLYDGMAPEEAAEWYHAAFGERIDVADFLETLRELGFTRAAGEAPAAPVRVRYRWLGRAMFSPFAWAGYAALMAATLITMVEHPGLRPRPGHVLFSPSLITVQLVLVAVQVPAVLWHEWFHVMAGRRLGLPTRLSVGRRMYYIVFETNLNGLLSVPRRRRYLPFMAGMLADLLLACGMTLLAGTGAPGWLTRFALAVAYTTLLRVGWQFQLFLRTDPYYALTTYLGSTDLAGASAALLRRWFRRPPAPGDDQDWSPRDRALAPGFAVFTLLGGGVLAVWLGYQIILVSLVFGRHAVDALGAGAVGEAGFWDSAVGLVLLLLQFVVLPLLVGGRRRRRARRSAEPGSGPEPALEGALE